VGPVWVSNVTRHGLTTWLLFARLIDSEPISALHNSSTIFLFYAELAAELAGATIMEREIDQLVQAIAIASDPSQNSLHHQALAYLSTIQENTNETWRLALHLFVDQNPNGSRKYPSHARFFGLRMLDEFLDNR
jgi:hypothetical protein